LILDYSKDAKDSTEEEEQKRIAEQLENSLDLNPSMSDSLKSSESVETLSERVSDQDEIEK